MYERFTDRARKVMMLANQAAQHFNHEYVGTEHILLGLIKEGSGVASSVFQNLGIDPRTISLEVERSIQAGPDMVTMGKLPQTPRARKVIAEAVQASCDIQNNYVGTEHILIGLLREREGIAGTVLFNIGVTEEKVRGALPGIFRNGNPTEEAAKAAVMLMGVTLPLIKSWCDNLTDDELAEIGLARIDKPSVISGGNPSQKT